MADQLSDSVGQCRNKVRSVVLVSPTVLPATIEGSLSPLDKMGNDFRINEIHNFIMIFIHYIYKYTPTYRVTLPSYPTRETKHQIGMALVGPQNGP